MPIMLALCSMFLHTYYAKNYAGIIDSGLLSSTFWADMQSILLAATIKFHLQKEELPLLCIF